MKTGSREGGALLRFRPGPSSPLAKRFRILLASLSLPAIRRACSSQALASLPAAGLGRRAAHVTWQRSSSQARMRAGQRWTSSASRASPPPPEGLGTKLGERTVCGTTMELGTEIFHSERNVKCSRSERFAFREGTTRVQVKKETKPLPLISLSPCHPVNLSSSHRGERSIETRKQLSPAHVAPDDRAARHHFLATRRLRGSSLFERARVARQERVTCARQRAARRGARDILDPEPGVSESEGCLAVFRGAAERRRGHVVAHLVGVHPASLRGPLEEHADRIGVDAFAATA